VLYIFNHYNDLFYVSINFANHNYNVYDFRQYFTDNHYHLCDECLNESNYDYNMYDISIDKPDHYDDVYYLYVNFDGSNLYDFADNQYFDFLDDNYFTNHKYFYFNIHDLHNASDDQH